MSAVLPQPGARTSAAIAVIFVVAGFVASVVLVRGVFAADFVWSSMQQGAFPPTSPPAPRPPAPTSPR